MDLPPRPTLEKRRTTTRRLTDTDENALTESLPGVLRGIAAATRKVLLPVRKVLAAKGAASPSVNAQRADRAVGENRSLAFASEGAVAGESMLPRVLYYGAWTLSGAAIAAVISQGDCCRDAR